MTWKKVNNADAGDATHHGGDSLDKVSDAFSAVDVDDIDMNCDFTLRSGKGHLRNPANTFSYNFVGGAITTANKNINYPVLTADDEPVFKNHPVTLAGKTIEIEDNTLALRDFSRVSIVGSTYYAIGGDGVIIASSTTDPEDVIQAAIDYGSTTWIGGGTYNFSSGFAGIDITSSNKLINMSRNASLQVPNGYTGYLMKLEGSILGVEVRGGKWGEQGTPAKLWKGLYLKSTGSSNALKHCKFSNIQIGACGWMVYLENTTSGAFINSMEFNNIWGYYPIIGFEWVDAASNDGYLHNHYYNIDIQADSNTTYGFKNAMSRSPLFVGCHVQDMDTAATQMEIHSSGADTVIIGGSLNSGGSAGLFTDNGSNTTFIARGGTGLSVKRPSSFGGNVTLTDGVNIPVGTTNGTKIGTSTSQKIGFYNKTPVTQRTGIADVDSSTVDGTYGAEEQAVIGSLRTKLNAVLQVLEDMGITAVA